MMDCVEIRSMLAGYHDGELSAADRARVDEHLPGCGDCSAVLSRLAGIDSTVGVPDPGPEYWDRFNRRIMDRLEGEAAAPENIVRPKRGWARRGLPYFLPAAAAAALLLVVVRQTGVDPFSRTAQPPAPPPSVIAAPPGEASPARRPALPEEKRKSAPEIARKEAGGSAPLRQERPPSPAAERFAAESVVKSELSAPPAPPPRDDAAAALRDEGMRAESAAPAQIGGKGVTAGIADRAASKSAAAAAPEATASACEEARSLADRGRLKDAESAQRACLERERAPAAQERGLVFLAELLDRQSRFAEAEEVLLETRRQFPGSRTVEVYLRQRSGAQGGSPPPGR